MSARVRPIIALVSLTLAASVAAGCSQTPNAPRADAGAASTSAAPSPEGQQITGDVRACLGVQSVLGHVASAAARWSPQRKPFDKTMTARLDTFSDQLAGQGPQAQDPKVRKAVKGIAESFQSLSDAMAERDRGGVNAAVLQTQASYKVLKTTCALD